MDESMKEYLSTARCCIIAGEKEDAYAHYGKVSLDEPGNAEADFFGAYLGYKSLSEDRNGTSAANAFFTMTENIEGAVKNIKDSELSEIEKKLILEGLVECYLPITRFLVKSRLSTNKTTIETGVLGLFALGDVINDEFGYNDEAMKLATSAWKEGVALQREFYGYKYNGVTPETYSAKIQKFEPTYTMPKKAGCISAG